MIKFDVIFIIIILKIIYRTKLLFTINSINKLSFVLR